MKITVNGRNLDIISPVTLGELIVLMDRQDDDVFLVNGFAGRKEQVIVDGDDVVLIKKGVIPDEGELEVLMCSRHTPKIHHQLKNATVGIAGLGGLGSNIAVALARIGIGKLLLLDYDVVEPSNLNRQHYEVNDIGDYKCDALVRHLEKINPYNAYVGINKKMEKGDAKEVFSEVDVIVEAFDHPDYKGMLVNDVLSEMSQPIVCGSGMAGLYNPNEIRTKRLGSRLFICGDGCHEAQAFEGLMAPRVIIAAGHQATMVCQIILDQVEVND